jgi:hypothetical protein
MAKNKPTKLQKRKARLRKAKQWIFTYDGAHIVRDYGKRFKVDPDCAAKDLESIGASTPEQREQLKLQEQNRLQKKREEREIKLQKELDERLENSPTPNFPDSGKPKNASNKTATKNPKKRCPNCNRAMKQQFIGLKHCKCGTSWSKTGGYFERTPNMVFALQRKVTKKGKNSIRTKQVPVIRHKDGN